MIKEDINWNREWFENIQTQPLGYWKDLNNQREFLKSLEKDLGILEPRDWGRVRVQDIEKRGGESLIKYYNRSLKAALEGIFSGCIL